MLAEVAAQPDRRHQVVLRRQLRIAGGVVGAAVVDEQHLGDPGPVAAGRDERRSKSRRSLRQRGQGRPALVDGDDDGDLVRPADVSGAQPDLRASPPRRPRRTRTAGSTAAAARSSRIERSTVASPCRPPPAAGHPSGPTSVSGRPLPSVRSAPGRLRRTGTSRRRRASPGSTSRPRPRPPRPPAAGCSGAGGSSLVEVRPRPLVGRYRHQQPTAGGSTRAISVNPTDSCAQCSMTSNAATTSNTPSPNGSCQSPTHRRRPGAATRVQVQGDPLALALQPVRRSDRPRCRCRAVAGSPTYAPITPSRNRREPGTTGTRASIEGEPRCSHVVA